MIFCIKLQRYKETCFHNKIGFSFNMQKMAPKMPQNGLEMTYLDPF